MNNVARAIRTALFYGLVLYALTVLSAGHFLAGLSAVAGKAPESILQANLFPSHRIQRLSVLILTGLVVLGLAMQFIRPVRRAGSILVVLVVALAFYVVDALCGQPVRGDLMVLFPVAGTVLLHPARSEVFAKAKVNRRALLLALASVPPWAAYAYRHILLQRMGVAGDIPADMQYWSWIATYALVVPCVAIIASIDLPGRRFAVWVAALTTVTLALESLLHPRAFSALPPTWALIAIGWALLYLWIARGYGDETV